MNCRVPDCDFSVSPKDYDDLELVGGRGWWDGNRGFCPEHAKALREGALSREDICSTFHRKERSDRRTDFIEMSGSRQGGFPPHVANGSDIGKMPIDEYHAVILREGTCPHDGCGFRGALLKYTGYNCPHMCPECGGVVHAA